MERNNRIGKKRFFKFIYHREYFNPSRFGSERYKKIKANSIEAACRKMIDHMNQWFNIGCKDYVYDEKGNMIDISDVGCIQHMIIQD